MLLKFGKKKFNPRTISNLKLWLDASNLGTQGYSLYFDGTNDYVQANNLITGYPFTIESWVNFDETNTVQRILGIAETSTTDKRFGITLSANSKISIVAQNTLAFANDGTTTILPNVWYHISAVFKSETDRKIYVNGLQEGTGTNSVNFNNSVNNKVEIGRHFDNNISTLKGKLSDVRIWNTTRSDSEILNNYNKRLIGNESGLVGYWKLNEGSSTTAKDYTSNANDGTITGALWNTSEPLPNNFDNTSVGVWKDLSGNGYDATQTTSANRPTFRTNQVNGRPVVSFDGSNDYLIISSGANGISRNISGATVFLVKNITTTSSAFVSFSIDNGAVANTGSSRMSIRKSGNAAQITGRRLDTDIQKSALGTSTLSTTKPSVIHGRYDYTDTRNMILYVNNISERTTAIDDSAAGNTSNTAPINGMILGAAVGATIGSFMTGYICEFLFYNRLLSVQESTSIYNYLKSKWGI